MNWTDKKPDPTIECVFVTAHEFGGHWSYFVYQFKKINTGDGEYMAWLNGDGEEYGDINDLSAGLYFVLSSAKEQSV